LLLAIVVGVVVVVAAVEVGLRTLGERVVEERGLEFVVFVHEVGELVVSVVELALVSQQ
jgi:hypothetical protein